MASSDVVDVILPVLDEVDALPLVLGAMPEGCRPVVVDNGSSDGSPEVARSLGAQVVYEPERGFGAACFAGLRAAEAPVVAFMDCDGTLDPADVPRLAVLVQDGSLDLAIGRRVATTRTAWPWHARVANRALAAYASSHGAPIRDLGPMRAAAREGLLSLGMRDRRFGWPLEMVLRAASAGWRVGELPVTYAPRIGRSKVTGTVGGTVRTVRDMLAVR